MAQYNQFNRRQILTKAKDELVSNLRLAQNKAMAAEKPEDCLDDELEGIRLEFINNQSYQIVAVCNCGLGCPAVKEMVNLPSIVSKKSGPTEVFFKVLNRGVRLTPVSAPIVLELDGSGETQSVNVTDAGEIK